LRRSLHKLSAIGLKRATAPGYLSDGGGLYLQITPSGARSWVFRYSFGGRRREMGLGAFSRVGSTSAPEVTLATAREKAAQERQHLAEGKDPIAHRDATAAEKRLQDGRQTLWDDAVAQFLAAHEATWRNAKHRQQWRNTLDTYAAPILGGLPVAEIGPEETAKVLDPIWHEKPETASRVRGRAERVLDWCRARGYRQGENPFRWRNNLSLVYPAKTKVRPVKHHAAVAIDKMPALYARLRKAEGMAALALRFLILTGARASEAAGARWDEIDLDAGSWTVAGSRMKSGRPHTVPLSAEVLAILKPLAKVRTGEHVFPSRVTGRPLSLAALSKALDTAGGKDATVHGMRSTFRDWGAERTNHARDVLEMALAHTIGDRVEAAYRRGDLLQKRAALMSQWARFLIDPPSAAVVSLRRNRA
jgi:integrase